MSEAIAGVPPPPPPPPPKDAAVAILFRRGPHGLEVFWLKRERSLSFAGGFYAFPGGRVDPADAAVPVVGHSGERADLVVACARELFEEAGVLRARGPTLPPEDLSAFRAEVLAGAATFGPGLARRGLTLYADDFPFAGRWVTPRFVPGGFDARFFLVETQGEEASVWPGELESGAWIAPSEALARWEAGTALLHPPNLHALQVMAGLGDVASALAALRQPPWMGPDFVSRNVEFQRGVTLVALKTPTLPPATHTNAYILGTGECVVVDPGSPDEAECAGLVELVHERGLTPVAVVLTHHHLDHVGGAGFTAAALGVPVWCHRLTAERTGLPAGRLLDEGDTIELAGPRPMRWNVLHTPGHARGHLTLVDARSAAAVVGDMVAGVGTIVIDPPEGDMGQYLAQLERLKAHVGAMYPSHGPVIPHGVAKLDEYLAHRRWREAKVLESLTALARAATSEEVVEGAYDDVAAFVWPIAERNTLAILLDLAARGQVRRDGDRWTVAG